MIFAAGKRPEQIVSIVRALREAEQDVLVTRLEADAAEVVLRELATGRYDVEARTLWFGPEEPRLQGKGTIAVGSDADIVIFDPERKETISVNNPCTHHMRVDYNAYEGISVTGFPETVISRGKVIVQDDEYLGRKGDGQFLKRGLYGGLR